MPKNKPLALALLCLAVPGAFAQGSINDARKGNNPGIVIWEQGQRAQPAAPAPATTSTGMNAAKSEPSGSSVLQRMFSTLRLSNPPSGTSLNHAKTLNAPDQGIPVPTAPATPR